MIYKPQSIAVQHQCYAGILRMTYSPVRNRRGVAISGGLEKNLKVNKWGGGCNKRGGGKSSQVNVYGVGCYKWMWREH